MGQPGGLLSMGHTELDTTEVTSQQQQQQQDDLEKEVTENCRGPRLNPWVGKIPWRRKWQPTPVLLPGKSHGWRESGRLQSMGSQRVRDD